jgi:hypothetical protein
MAALENHLRLGVPGQSKIGHSELRWNGGQWVRREILAALAALLVAGCGQPLSTLPEVTLPVSATAPTYGTSCILMHEVMDVVADASGVPANGATGEPLVWPKGMTGRRLGSETEVVDPSGAVVMVTGGRYRVCPSEYLDGWAVGGVSPCPDCALGQGLD